METSSQANPPHDRDPVAMETGLEIPAATTAAAETPGNQITDPSPIQESTGDKTNMDGISTPEKTTSNDQATEERKDNDSTPNHVDEIEQNHETQELQVTADSSAARNESNDVRPGQSKSKSTTTGSQTTTSQTATTTSTSTNSGWGSYLKKAVANVEQTLDKVLQEGPVVDPKDALNQTLKSTSRLSVQERLAMAVKNKAQRPITPTNADGSASASPRASFDRVSFDRDSNASKSKDSLVESNGVAVQPPQQPAEGPVQQPVQAPTSSLPSPSPSQIQANATTAPPTQSSEIIPFKPSDVVPEYTTLDPLIVFVKDTIAKNPTADTIDTIDLLAKLLEGLNSAKKDMATETHQNAERIASFESKLKYLSRSEVERAEKAKGTSLEKRLAEKEKQLALIIEEGSALSKQELKLRDTIKALRLKEREATKQVSTQSAKLSALESEVTTLREQVQLIPEKDKKIAQLNKQANNLESQVTAITATRDSLQRTIDDLRAKLSAAESKFDEKTLLAQNDEIKKANATIDTLNESLEKARNDLALANKIHSEELQQVQLQLEKETKLQAEMKNQLEEEIKSLEAKTEYYRSLNEASDAHNSVSSSGAGGNTGGNEALLRQIDELQAQHAVARDNWHGIEFNMHSRISSLEEELQDLKSRESQLRKRLKASAESLKEQNEENERLSDELSKLKHALSTLKTTLSDKDFEMDKLQKECDNYSTRVSELQTNIDQLTTKLEDKEAELSRALSQSNAPSVNTSTPVPAPEFFDHSLQDISSISQGFAQGTTPLSPPQPFGEDFNMKEAHTRRFSGNANFLQSQRQMSLHSTGYNDHEDSHNDLDHSESASVLMTANDTNRHDTSSAYATSNGAPMQLISKMNITVRRLESELASSRHELEKMSKAKDESYKEVVKLMDKVEQLNNFKKEAMDLRAKVENLEKREQTALEMLGEKSEQVQELRADVDDLKAMYRQQIEQLVDQLAKK